MQRRSNQDILLLIARRRASPQRIEELPFNNRSLLRLSIDSATLRARPLLCRYRGLFEHETVQQKMLTD